MAKISDHIPPELSNLHLSRDEKILATWSPHLAIYLRKILFVGFITALIFTLPSLSLNVVYIFIVIPVAMTLYIIMFEDIDEWYQNKWAIWTLTNRRLVYQNEYISDRYHSVPLERIRVVKKRNLFSVLIKLDNRLAFSMPYLPDRKKICETIQMARDSHLGINNADEMPL